MALNINAARQSPMYLIQEINYNDLISGASTTVINLPANAQVVNGEITVVTAFNSATSDTLSLGDAGSATRYLNATNIHATGRTALTLSGYRAVAPNNALKAVWTGAGAAPTAGLVRICIEYLMSQRAEFTQD